MSAAAPPFLRELYAQALSRWVPTWLAIFTDRVHGGFHERIDARLAPLPLGYKRLLTQCRQLFVYSQAYRLTQERRYLAPLRAGWSFMQSYRRPQAGLWAFSLTPQGHLVDPSCDLYAHAFVVLALSHYVCATEDAAAARDLHATLAALDTHFRAEVGFYERLDADARPCVAPRRQNSHMHLFEACMLAHQLTGAPRARAIAQEVLQLFLRHFFDAATGTLVEHFATDWAVHPHLGHAVEPGHHHEWAWLWHRWQTAMPKVLEEAPMTAACRTLVGWANTHAWDPQQGGFFNEMRRADGHVLRDTKRIWHLTEALKVSCAAPECPGPDARTLAQMLRTYVAPDGTWVETKHRDLQPATDFLPGTTPYHLLMGVVEATQLAERRVGGPPMAAGVNKASP